MKSTQPLVSCIVPIYNVEDYLEECLQSIINQSYTNLEIILVNDGSKDQSQKIIDRYKLIDKRTVSIKQKNQGLNMARAAGAALATGDYITFIDSDDFVHRDYVNVLYKNLVKSNVDISICGHETFIKKEEVDLNKHKATNYSEQVLKGREEALLYFLWQIPSPQNVFQMTAWGKLFKASIIKSTDWKLSNYSKHEDNLELLQWYSMATNGISVLSTQLYYYRNRPGSISYTKECVSPDGRRLNFFESINEVYEVTKEYLDDNHFNIATLNNFAHINRLQVFNFYLDEKLNTDDIVFATKNWDKIINAYNHNLAQKDSIIESQAATLQAIYTSQSWVATKPLRLIKRVLLGHK